MSISEAKRQKKMARKLAKNKSRRQQITTKKQTLTTSRGKALAAATGEIIGCYRCDAHEPVELNGMIPVLIVRRGPHGMLAAAQFLIDFWCLGVKDCFFHMDYPEEINNLIDDIEDRMGLTEIDPSAGRAMVEQGVDYARNLGLAPHADFSIAKLIWGDLPVGDLPDDIEFGKNGKPCYLSGPFDDQHRQQEIVNSLQAHAGEGNYKYFIGGLHFEDDEFND